MQNFEQERHTVGPNMGSLDAIGLDGPSEAPLAQWEQADGPEELADLEELAHEARNMGTTLGLYCELLEEPGVLSPRFQHYARELKIVAAASRRLVERLTLLHSLEASGFGTRNPGAAVMKGTCARVNGEKSIVTPRQESYASRPEISSGETPSLGRWPLLPALPIRDLADEVRSNRDLLAALAGPSIQLTVNTSDGALPVRLTGEDLTRVLVNLVKNAVEAMPHGGRIQLRLCEECDTENVDCKREFNGIGPAHERVLALRVEDTGPGIAADSLEAIFEAGYTTRRNEGMGHHGHHGVGLAVTRAIVEAAGGRIRAGNRVPAGAIFTMELPVPEC